MEHNAQILRDEPKDGFGYIYMYEFDDGMRYIGKTTHSVCKRHREHNRGSNQYVDRKMKHHSFKLMVICEVELEKLDE